MKSYRIPSGVRATREIEVVPQIRPSPRSRRTISARGSSGLSPAPFSSGSQPPQASSTLTPGLGCGNGLLASRGVGSSPPLQILRAELG